MSSDPATNMGSTQGILQNRIFDGLFGPDRIDVSVLGGLGFSLSGLSSIVNLSREWVDTRFLILVKFLF